MSKRKNTALLLFAFVALILTSLIITYQHVLQSIREDLIETLDTLEIEYVDTTLKVNSRIIMLNISIKIENRAKYTVIVDSIKMNVYINNIFVSAANPYSQSTVFSILPGEKSTMVFICSTSNQHVMEMIRKGNCILYGNGTISGHISHLFFFISYIKQFSFLYEIS
ncbi:MAG: hypothetical protein QXR45_07500 [Candidatus Bathyarchaeia archaeon]